MKAALLGWALALVACARPAATTAPTPPPSPFPPSTYVIFAGAKARELVKPCSRIAPGPVEGVWTPTDSDIALLEQALPGVFEKQYRVRRPNGKTTARDYYRQYGGLIIAHRRVIYLNAFHKEELLDDQNVRDAWPTHFVGMCDGGLTGFGVEYDPATRQFANFAFDGTFP